MHVSHIALQNWKNFKQAEADLAGRMFIIGPNASGKSNLLDAFRFLRDVASEGLSTAVEKRGGVSRIRCLAARQSPAVAIRVRISANDSTPLWEYGLTFNQDAQRTPLVREEIVRDLQRDVTIEKRPNAEDESDPLRLTQTALEQIIANQEFREVADFFRSVSYQHIIPQVVRDPQGFSPRPIQDDPFGRDFLQRLWDTNQRTREAWLRRISMVLGKAVPQLKSLEVEMDKQGTPHLVGRFEHWRPHDARQDESQFSDGTLRLLGLMWAMFEGDGPLLLEEPELSLHRAVVSALPPMLAQLQEEIRRMRKNKPLSEARQLLISTHSEVLLNDKGISAHEVLRIKPSMEGSVLVGTDAQEEDMLREGLTPADVLLPKTSPENGQIVIEF